MITGKATDTVIAKVTSPFIPSWIPSYTSSAEEAYDTVLKNAGVTIPRRDTLDQRIVNDVQNRIGRLIDVQGDYPHATPYAQTVTAWPNLNAEPAPTDTDHDGMPDSWEIANGLNPNSAADRGVFAANGYTNLENYLNGITASATPISSNIATATWPLLTDQMPTVIGNITASNQVIGSLLTGVTYGSIFGGIKGWQKVGATSYLPKVYTANAYLEYKVTPASGKIFTVNAIGLGALGGGGIGVRTAIYYSLDSFATANPVGGCFYNGTTYAAINSTPVPLLSANTALLVGEQSGSIPTSIKVLPTQTLTLRVYPWNTSTANRYFANQNVTINGITADAPLPVTLVNLSAAVVRGKVELIWKTVNETNMKGYEVKKSSDGQSFATIGAVVAKNLTTNYYPFTDNNKPDNMAYYRLKMIDKDGSFRYSFVVSVQSNSDNTLVLYPNPVKSAVAITHNKAGIDAIVKMYAMDGRQLIEKRLEQNAIQSSIDVSKLVKGSYLLTFINGAKKINKIFIKEQ